MKKIIKVALAFVFLFTSMISLLAQKYNTTMGVRLSDDFGISFTQRIAKKHTLELVHQDGFFSNKPRMTSITSKRHYGLLGKRFNVFLGGGGFMAGSSDAYYDSPGSNDYGLAMTAGAEFTLGRLNFSADYSPNYAIKKSEGDPRFISTSGVSIRYVMVKRKRERRLLKKLKLDKKSRHKKKKKKAKAKKRARSNKNVKSEKKGAKLKNPFKLRKNKSSVTSADKNKKVKQKKSRPKEEKPPQRKKRWYDLFHK